MAARQQYKNDIMLRQGAGDLGFEANFAKRPVASERRRVLPLPSKPRPGEVVDFAQLMAESTPCDIPAESDLAFEATPLPVTTDNHGGSVAPVARPVAGQEQGDELPMQHAFRRPYYALGAVVVAGVAAVAFAAWSPSQSNVSDSVPAAVAPAAPVPHYKVEDLPMAGLEDPERVYREIQQQLEQEARATREQQERAAEMRAAKGTTEAGDDIPKEYAASPEPSPAVETELASSAAPAPELPAFDPSAANAALAAASSAAAACRAEDQPGATVARVAVTFAPAGRVVQAVLTEGVFVGTRTGGCIAQAFRGARVPPFSGPAVTVRKSVSLR